MLDLVYVLIGTLFFLGCWFFTKACTCKEEIEWRQWPSCF
jgi:hypothetical protein